MKDKDINKKTNAPLYDLGGTYGDAAIAKALPMADMKKKIPI